jgi:hypothetical protein
LFYSFAFGSRELKIEITKMAPKKFELDVSMFWLVTVAAQVGRLFKKSLIIVVVFRLCHGLTS